MIGRTIDALINALSPSWAVSREQSRRILRAYQGAESNRLTNHAKPKNQAADTELGGPWGADQLRAWSRKLVRDNAYAWGVVDTIVSSVIGSGIKAQSMMEFEDGSDVEDTNWQRDETWERWCEVCDINGLYNFDEVQRIAQREIVEAGEVLIHLVNTPKKEFRGISRPVPFALELIEADRLASDQDTYALNRDGGKRIVRGVEMDELGKPIAYWIYPDHPNAPQGWNRQPKRIDAKNIIHLFRRDRVGQSRGVSWFAPIMSWIRDLGVYVDNEIQASAVASCFGVAIKTDGAFPGLTSPTGEDTSDANGNQFEYLEPAMVVRLNKGESIESINPGRPNSASEPWINLMLRGISVGTGLSYETVSRDYSKTSYSSSRTSQLEDRRRFRCWQQYIIHHLCQPVRDRFTEAAALAGLKNFPTMRELLEDRRSADPVEWQTPEWEWVDPQNEQQASQSSIDALQSTYQSELGSRGRNWRQVFYQRAKEETLKRQLGLTTLEQAKVDAKTDPAKAAPIAGTGELGELGRLQFKNNRKAIEDLLKEYASGIISERRVHAYLSGIGLSELLISELIADAADGTVNSLPPAEEVAA
jgi:lambda family phage portal protein